MVHQEGGTARTTENTKKTELEKKFETKDHSSATNSVINIIERIFSEEFPILESARDNIHTLIKGPPKEHPTCSKMKFDEKLSIPLQQPHTDQVVVTLKIGQMKVRRVPVDTGSTTNLITMDCLCHMKYEEKHLRPIDRPLIGFGGGRVIPLRMIVLLVRVSEKNKGRSLAVHFTVIDIKFSYNAIMGLILINKIKAVISTHQLLLQYERDDAKVEYCEAIKNQPENASSIL